MEGVKIIWGNTYYYTFIISFLWKQRNTQKSEVFLLRTSSGNVNASGVVTCEYPQTYLKTTLEKLHFLRLL